MKKVTEAEFNKFVEEYPRTLTKFWDNMPFPPVHCYSDFEKYEGYDAIKAMRKPVTEKEMPYKETGEFTYEIEEKS